MAVRAARARAESRSPDIEDPVAGGERQIGRPAEYGMRYAEHVVNQARLQ
jgi:hypothetical protein